MGDNIKKLKAEKGEFYKEIFDLIDKDQDGSITAEEYHSFLQSFNNEGGFS